MGKESAGDEFLIDIADIAPAQVFSSTTNCHYSSDFTKSHLAHHYSWLLLREPPPMLSDAPLAFFSYCRGGAFTAALKPLRLSARPP